jgi:hypothetical protein
MNEMKERENYEWRIRARVDNLKDRQEELGEKILRKHLEIVLNHDPSKNDLFEKDKDKMEKESDDLDLYIDALEKK